MAADVRALLKAKTQERGKRIAHPLAAYNASNQLRCTLCAIVVKDNDTAWSGHLQSKGHRTNVGRAKEQQKKEEERMRLEKGKRKALVEEDDEEDGMEEDTSGERGDAGPVSKRQKTEEPERPSQGIPSNFFSDPSRTIPTTSSDDEEEKTTAPAATTAQPSQLDLEWAQFERDVLSRTANATLAANGEPRLSRQDIFNRATIGAEEELVYSQDDGFPEHLQRPGAAGGNGASGMNASAEVLVEIPEDETPQQAKERKDNDERELIMDRIMDEERAQEDADEKLRALKARLALVKKKREEDRKKKAGGGG